MIDTARMRLRPMAEADRGWFMAQAASAQVMEHLGGAQGPEQSGARFDHMRAQHAREGFSFWLMERRDDGVALGICGLKRIDATNAPESMVGALEIGWRLEPFAWGQGYAREAAEAALAHAFETVRGDEVYALTNIGNAASWGLMLRLGMHRRADLDFIDPRYDPVAGATIVHRIAADAWLRTQADSR